MPPIDEGKLNIEITLPKRILGLPRNVFFLGLTSFFNDFSSEMVFSVFPAFFTSVLKTGAASIGFVDGFAEGLSNFFKIYSGNLSDRIQSRKPFVVAGYMISVATRPFYGFISTVGAAFGLRVMDRVGKGLRDAPRDAIISLSSPKEEIGRSFGYHRAMDTLGGILGPLTAYLILKNFPLNFHLVFFSAFFLGLLTIFTFFFITDVVLKVPENKVSLISAFKNLSLHFKIFIVSIFILSAGSLPIVVMLLKVEDIGLLIADIPLFYMVYSLSYMGFSALAGKVSDKRGAKRVIFCGYGILLISYFFLYQAHTAFALFFSFLLLGLFPALTDGVQRSLASQMSSTELRGSAMGLLNASAGFGALIAGIAGGYTWQVCGPNVAFVASGIIVMFGLALFFVSTLKRYKI